MAEIKTILKNLDKSLKEASRPTSISFKDYLKIIKEKPAKMFRDIFQYFHDMVHFYVPESINEYPDDQEFINYVKYNFNRLFVKGSDNPFFADRLFSNRFMNLIKSFNHGADRNKIYFFIGPPGSGKSTFLKNLLYRFERYMKTDEGEIYETVWKIDKSKFLNNKSRFLTDAKPSNNENTIEYLLQAIASNSINRTQTNSLIKNVNDLFSTENYITVPCPNHDPPFLLIPKTERKKILADLIIDKEFKKSLFNEKKYKWIFKHQPCTICSSLYEALMDKFNSPIDILNMITPRLFKFNRRLSEGISVYNTGDIFFDGPLTNPLLQDSLDNLFGHSNKVKYVYSHMAKTNNGIYVIMDVKQNNKDRVLNLHGLISDGVHKVEDLEEYISTIFMGLINPQDKEFLENTKSLSDRITYIKIPYVLDYKTECEIYKNNFGNKITELFLPGVLENFSKVIVSSRLNNESEGLKEWINNPADYLKYCDSDLLILKMEIYTGIIPEWILEKDRRSFKANIRKKIIEEGEAEGFKGITGRESIHVFNNFISYHRKKQNLITMEMLYNFFDKQKSRYKDLIPKNFMDSLMSSYNYTILQHVKQSLYSYNISRISIDIQNYIFSINFDTGSVEKSTYTGEKLEITENYLSGIEDYLIGKNIKLVQRKEFRKDVLQKYVSTATKEMKIDKKQITKTKLYKELHDMYIRNLKTNALDPFVDNANFRNAIKEYNTKEFSSHDKKIQLDVTFLIKNLIQKYNYTEEGAKLICIYVVDKELAKKFNDE